MTQHYQKDYPRPQFLRTSWKNLNGTWDFRFDDSDCGEREQWFHDFIPETSICVPFTYETKMSGIGREETHSNVWYHRTVEISEDDYMDKRVLLHFEGSDYTTKVWVNRTYMGEHTGMYSRFTFDITNQLISGINHITVKAEDSMDTKQPRGKQRWRKESFDCWYVQTTGIWKTVWLETVPRDYLTELKITPLLQENSVELFGFSNVKEDGWSMQAIVSFDGMEVARTRTSVKSGEARMKLNLYNTEIDKWGIKSWSPEHPDLYDLEIQLYHQDELIDRIYSYFGMREIRVQGNQVLLNGDPLYQRLILDQGYWKDSHLTPPDEEALIEDIDKVMALGYNGVRKHQKVEDERFLYWCDVKGLLVWSEIGSAYDFSDYAVSEFTRQWMEIVKQNYNHPSIITWTPFNESWGIREIKTNKKQQQFTQSIYYWTKSYDSDRPVILNDGWEHTISDIITLHDYEASGEVFFERYCDLCSGMEQNSVYHDKVHKPFAEGFYYAGQPVIISEFGGIAFHDGNSGWGYGEKVDGEEAFLSRFDSITTAIKKLPFVCGYCYTQVTDVQQEINGLMDADRNFKISPEKIKKINKK